jgi:predicted nucleic acid-binding protein
VRIFIDANIPMYAAGKPRDLLHAAVMGHNGIEEILSVDKDFDGIDEVKRQDPLNFG